MDASYVCIIFFVCSTLLRGSRGDSKYLLYSVKSGEGFNLRRDAHMRAATLTKTLRERTGQDWTLVLPPWPLLPHWKTDGRRRQTFNLKWELFFDLSSLSEFVPSIEWEEYLQREGKTTDMVLHLNQGFTGTTKWEEKAELVQCPQPPASYKKVGGASWTADLFGVSDFMIKSLKCLSVMGFTDTLVPRILEMESKSVLVESMDVVMHTHFGGMDYWKSRSSMVYALHLREEGNKFMSATLQYDPGNGRGREAAVGGGGDYLSIHLRRGDYLYARPNDIPSVTGAANQINVLLKRHNLHTVFLATDTNSKDKKEIKKLVKGRVVWYVPSDSVLHHYGDGGVAIIDQWIASHGKIFVGSFESTFSFRIREDRQMMGFSRDSTFNQLCGVKDNENDPSSCDPPTYWKIPEELIPKIKINSRRQSEL